MDFQPRRDPVLFLWGGSLILVGVVGLCAQLARADLLWNSAVVTTGGVLLAAVLGGTVGWILGWTDLPGRTAWIGGVWAWATLPLIVQLAAWDSLWGRLSWLSALYGVDYAPWFRGWAAVIWIQGLASVPWFILLVLALRHTVSIASERDAQLAVPLWRVATSVTLSQHRLLACVLGLVIGVRLFEQFDVTDVYQFRTWAEVWYLGFALGQYDSVEYTGNEGFWNLFFGSQLSESAWGTTDGTARANWSRLGSSVGAVAAISCLLAGLTICLWTGLQRWIRCVRPLNWETEHPLRLYRPWIGQGVIVAVVLLPQFIFLVNLVIRSGLRVTQEQGRAVITWELGQWWEAMLAAIPNYGVAMQWSWLIGLVSAIVTWTLALALAWPSRRRTWMSAIALAVIVVSLAWPSPLVSFFVYRTLHLSSWPWLQDIAQTSILGPVIALLIKHVGIALAFMMLMFRQYPANWEEEWQLSGQGHWSGFWHLAVRIPWRGHVLLILCLSLMGAGDQSTTFATIPPGMDTLPRRLLGDLHAGASASVAAGCLWQILLIHGLVWSTFAVYHYRQPRFR